MFQNVHTFACTMLRLSLVLAIAAFVIGLVAMSKAQAQNMQKVVYTRAFPKPVGQPAKAKPIEFVWFIAATYRSAARPDTCRFEDTGERGRISVLRTMQNPFNPGEYAWVGTDVMSDEAALEACMVKIDPTKVERERKYAHQ